MPASRSSHTKTDPDLIDWRSFSDSRRWTLGSRPRRQASKSMMASAGVRTCPLYVSMSLAVSQLYICFLFLGVGACACSHNRLGFRRGSGRSKPGSSRDLLRRLLTSKEGRGGSSILGKSISIRLIEGRICGIATSARSTWILGESSRLHQEKRCLVVASHIGIFR